MAPSYFPTIRAQLAAQLLQVVATRELAERVEEASMLIEEICTPVGR